MFRNLVTFLLIAGVFFGAPIFAQTAPVGYELAPPEPWITAIPAFDKSSYLTGTQSQNVNYHVIDFQINAIDPADSSSYYMREYELLNSTGVQENSRIEIVYDPAYEKIHLHEISIFREGKVVNKLETSNIRVIQQEQDLESLIYNGTQMVSILLNDVRKGDLVRYGYTRFGSNPIFNGNREFTFNTDFGVHIGRYRYRLLAALNNGLNIRRFHSDVAIHETVLDEVIEYTVDLKDSEPFIYEDDTPNWRIKGGRITFSDFKDWSDVVNWALPMYQQTVGSSPEIRDIAESLKTKYGSTESSKGALIGGALQWVQEEIRYFGIELGENSHQPSMPEETLARRYGDCKDKTVLLISLLAELGVEAFPALVDTEKWLLAENDPSRLHAFDHVIVYLENGGQPHWLDGTVGFQKGELGKFSEPDFGKALIVRQGELELTQMHPIKLADQYQIEKKIRINSSNDGSASMEISSLKSGALAESMRARISNNGLDELQEQYEDFYRRTFPSLVSQKSVDFQDSIDNTLTVNEYYEIADFWDASSTDSRIRWLYADDIYSSLEAPEDAYVRKTPYVLNHPLSISERIVVNLPWQVKDRTSSEGESNEFFELKRTTQYIEKKSQLIVVVDYKSLAMEVPVAQMKKYADAIGRAKDIVSIYIEERGYQLVDSSFYDTVVTFLAKHGYWLFLVLPIGMLYALIEWLLESKFNKDIPVGKFFPVSMVKIFLLSILTFGIYIAYWFYKNFEYLKGDGEKVIPMLRAIFSVVFYFSLYRFVVKKTGDESYSKVDSVRIAFLAIIFAVTYSIAGNYNAPLIVTLIFIPISLLLLTPILKRINKANGLGSDAYIHNSKWRLRHLAMFFASAVFLTITFAQESKLTPTDILAKGTELWEFQQRHIADVIGLEDDEQISYFFSDSSFDFRLDGNGYTDRTIFSYWQDSEGDIQFSRRARGELESLVIGEDGNYFDSKLVTLFFSDDTSMQWNAPSEIKDTKLFVQALQAGIKK